MVRVIAGSAKGTKLNMVPGDHVRPTVDRVKESLFNVIGPYFEGGQVLDLFAGTGSLGIEALSRGMEYAVFVDKSPVSTRVVRSNLKVAKMEEIAESHSCDARFALKKLKDRHMQFQLIFLDPPYHKGLLLTLLEGISTSEVLARDGMIIAEHAKGCQMPEELKALVLIRELHYGNTFMSIYKCKELS